MAEHNTHFRDLSEIELGAIAARGALARSGADPARIDHVVFGNAMQTSANALYGARHVALKAGLPDSVPALTLNRLCGSGIQSVVTAASLIGLEEAAVVLAGGMENMTQAPHVVRGLRAGLRMGHARLEDALLVGLLDSHCGYSMAQTADNLAQERGITRAEADRYALRSQQAAGAAVRAGKLRDEIVPVTVRESGREVAVLEDNHRRPDTTLEGLARLPPAFQGKGYVTAGNASGMVDGAAAVVVASAAAAKALPAGPLGRVMTYGVAGVPPQIMGIGPVPAIRQALDRAGLSLSEIDLFEINEAFAAQYLAVEKELALDRERVNVNGGAVALGHPLGATGTRLVLTLLLELKRRGGRFGIASACIGGGQGIAVVVEAFAPAKHWRTAPGAAPGLEAT
ncbi:MAG: acetyl-CoA C-acyltransferase [Acidobacteria bacterium]|nr:acetyl-CoA C-acyltransferase [Acidobacteriota bacterium]